MTALGPSSNRWWNAAIGVNVIWNTVLGLLSRRDGTKATFPAHR